MPGSFHDQGEHNFLEAYFKGQNRPSTWYLGLFMDGSSLPENYTLSDFQEVNMAGYARKPINDGDWTVTNDLAEGPELTFIPEEEWLGVTGWFLTNVASGTSGLLIASEFFASQYDLLLGEKLKITPKITAS